MGPSTESFLCDDAKARGGNPVLFVDSGGAAPGAKDAIRNVDIVVKPNLAGLGEADFQKKTHAAFRGKRAVNEKIDEIGDGWACRASRRPAPRETGSELNRMNAMSLKVQKFRAELSASSPRKKSWLIATSCCSRPARPSWSRWRSASSSGISRRICRRSSRLRTTTPRS